LESRLSGVAHVSFLIRITAFLAVSALARRGRTIVW
jgi:hypothetical protein